MLHFYYYNHINVITGLRSSVEKKTHRHFFCPSDQQSCHNPNHYTSSVLYAWGCPSLRSAAIIRSKKKEKEKNQSLLIKRWSVNQLVLFSARKPTSEDDLRDPGSSHLDWLYRSFMMRNRVTNSKPLLIFLATPVQEDLQLWLFIRLFP